MFSNALTSVLTCNLPCMRPQHKTSDTDDIITDHALEPVLLNVYDIDRLNEYMVKIGIGIFHSGVEVYGIEYGYGGHHHRLSGIFDMEPRNVKTLGEYFNLQGRIRFKETVLIGYTDFTRDEVDRIRTRLGRKFRGNKYHIIDNNCNHFSAAFTRILCRKDIPAWVNRLAYVGSFIPFLHKVFPRQS